jgi:hypothetical protein
MRGEHDSLVSRLDKYEADLEHIKSLVLPQSSSGTGSGGVEKKAMPPPPASNNNNKDKGIESSYIPPPTAQEKGVESSEIPPPTAQGVQGAETAKVEVKFTAPPPSFPVHSPPYTLMRVHFEGTAAEPLQNLGTPYYTPLHTPLGYVSTPYYTPVAAPPAVSKPHVPKSADLPAFTGEETSKLDADKWVFKVEQRIILEDIAPNKQVMWAGFHLEGYALSWWRSVEGDPLHAHSLATGGWKYFKRIFTKRFGNLNKEENVHNELDILRQGKKSTAAYTVEFLDLIRKIPNKSERVKYTILERSA